jgi:GT2 family glycosyltransferase
MPDLVSVIIPNYNRRDKICTAIDSALNQDYPNIEVIVTDDGSTDGSYEFLSDKYQQQNFSIIKSENHGVSHARNLALKQAQGKWVAFLDSDDFFHLNKISSQMNYLEQNQSYRICHCDEIWFLNGKRINPHKKHQKTGGDIFAKSTQLCSISISTVIISKELLFEVGLFDQSLPACEDYDLWLKITAQYPVLFLNKLLTTKFGGHADQLSKKYPIMDQFRISALENILKDPHLSATNKSAAKQTLKHKIAIILKGAIKHNNQKFISKFSNYHI